MKTAQYRVELRLDGQLIGDVRKIAQNLNWVRRRTAYGVDSITFTVNDVIFENWLKERNTTMKDILRPLALDCRIVRNDVDIVGGFLATVPAYQPNVSSANLSLQFDGYLNFLNGVYIFPTPASTLPAGQMVAGWITMADLRAETAGKAFGFSSNYISSLATITQTFDEYKSVKSAIADRCDNVQGAGKFDVYFRPDRSYDVVADSEFGVNRTYTIRYPTALNGVSALSISSAEVQGLATSVIGIGSGETSSDDTQNTAITYQQTDNNAVETYGYAESLLQQSSVTLMTTLQDKVATELDQLSNMSGLPQLTMSGRQVAPSPNGEENIWIGDVVTIQNDLDVLGTTNGKFRVQELSVAVSATNAETITPTLESVDGSFSTSGNWQA